MSVDSNSPVDPRVQIELEKLNTATDNINKYEVELDEAKNDFRQLLIESLDKIKQSSHKLSNSIQTAKPYYEARLYTAQLTKECQLAAVNYEKAKSHHAAAKEMVFLAEQGLGEQSTLDTACQEMLSHAASRVNQSQIECVDTRNMLKICQLKYDVANSRVMKLQSQLKSAIKASRPYYELRANYNGLLKIQKKRIEELETNVSDAKAMYNDALKNLEKISEEIHKMREERRLSDNNDDVLQQQQRRRHHFDDNDDDGLNDDNDTGQIDNANGSAYMMSHSSEINSFDEYLSFPPKLSTNASPVRQQKIDSLDCPHLLKDFVAFGQQQQIQQQQTLIDDCVARQSSSTEDSDPIATDITNISSDIEQWTEIRLSNSESTSSGYSQHSMVDDRTPTGSTSSSSTGAGKVTCTTIFTTDNFGGGGGGSSTTSDHRNGKDDETLSTWITKSSSLKSSGRRQSLDLLIDASDRVKDVFTSGFQKVGKTLERRNSESEMCTTDSTDFFSFSRPETKDGLSDEQVENLLLNEECVVDMLKNVLNISKK